MGPTPAALEAGSAVGEFVVERPLATGSSSAVYVARHSRRGDLAALKVLHPLLAASAKLVERFQREVEIIGLLRHPNVVRILSFGTLRGGQPWYAMELLDGRTLEAELSARGRLEVAEAAGILRQVCAAVQAAHDVGVVHRDLKAANVFLAGGAARLLDFGVAKLLEPESGGTGFTTVGRHVGTLTAMAPEQIRGGAIDARTDVYALGVLLFHLVTGRLPFAAADPVEVERMQLQAPPPPPSSLTPVGPAIDAICARAMAKKPEERFPSADAFRAALDEAAGVSGQGAAESEAVAILVAADDPQALDAASEQLAENGFQAAVETAASLLAVRTLPGDAAGRSAACREALALAGSLAGPALRCTLHAGLVRVSGEAIEGGPLLAPGSWPAATPRGDVMATEEFLRFALG